MRGAGKLYFHFSPFRLIRDKEGRRMVCALQPLLLHLLSPLSAPSSFPNKATCFSQTISLFCYQSDICSVPTLPSLYCYRFHHSLLLYLQAVLAGRRMKPYFYFSICSVTNQAQMWGDRSLLNVQNSSKKPKIFSLTPVISCHSEKTKPNQTHFYLRNF